MPEYVVRVRLNVIEEYEYNVVAPDPGKAEKAIAKHIKNIENIDPWKVRRFDVQETTFLETKEAVRVSLANNKAKPIKKF